jgi:hypothetical protein
VRINVYAEELSTETEWVTKVVDGKKFFAVRLFLKSAKELHHTINDDDRTAITFWVPWRQGTNHHQELIAVFDALAECAARLRDFDAT